MTTALISRGEKKVAWRLRSSHQIMAFGDKAPWVRINSGRRAKHQAPAGQSPAMHGPSGRTSSAGDLRLIRSNRRSRSSMQEGEEEAEEETRAICPRITRSNGNFRTALYAQALQSQPTASLKNETWDDVATTSSARNRAVKHVQSRSGHISDENGSDRSQFLLRPLPTPRQIPLKPSLVSFSTTKSRSKVATHVHFTFTDNEICHSYEVTKNDISNSWLDIDVSSAIEAIESESRNTIVSFGPTGRFTASDTDVCKNGKGYMVLIQQPRLIAEMLGQRTNLRHSVLEEQARQKREGVVDIEEMYVVASKQSKWGVELAKSSWWLHRT